MHTNLAAVKLCSSFLFLAGVSRPRRLALQPRVELNANSTAPSGAALLANGTAPAAAPKPAAKKESVDHVAMVLDEIGEGRWSRRLVQEVVSWERKGAAWPSGAAQPMGLLSPFMWPRAGTVKGLSSFMLSRLPWGGPCRFKPLFQITHAPPAAVPACLPAAARGEKVVIAQTAPAVRVAIGEEFDIPAGTATTGQMVSALKKLGFHYVFGAPLVFGGWCGSATGLAWRMEVVQQSLTALGVPDRAASAP
jgi:hypothetical protein